MTLKAKFDCITKVSIIHIYRITIKWMIEYQPGSLILLPLLFPTVFILMFYKQYLFQKALAAMIEMNKILNKIIIDFKKEAT